MRILHLSDTHFGAESKAVQRALLLLADELQPDVVALSGDLTERGRADEFSSAADFVRVLPAPVVAVPGSHDLPRYNPLARGLRPYRHFRLNLGSEPEPIFEHPRLLLLGVNSSGSLRGEHGAISRAQINRVRRVLAAAGPEQLRVVVMHNPVRADGTDTGLVRGHHRAAQAWVDAGLDLLLTGHTHHGSVAQLSEPGQRLAWTVHAGTALCAKLKDRQHNSFNVIDYRNREGVLHCHLERWDYHGGSFRLSHQRELPLCRAAAC